jgi:hypothetical protein
MRTIAAALAAGATALLGACAQTPKQPPQIAASDVPGDWVLIAPPDNVDTVAFIETFEFLPDGDTSFPRSTNGLSEQDRASLRRLFEQVAAQPTPEDRVEMLTEISARTEAPVKEWREVRVFKSAVACNSTRAELIKVTDTQTKKVGAYSDMPREEYQWPLLAKSFKFSRCVPAAMAPSVL